MHPDDARDLRLHRVIESCIASVAMQFGKTRAEMIEHFDAFLEAEREEQAERAVRAIHEVCQAEGE